ncbi:MAG: hypothetical protein ACOY3D_03820 [Candidatus Omnitrophota bacterium]
MAALSFRNNQRGQHIVEYALVVAVIAAAAVAMRTYLQRAAQGTIKIIENEVFKNAADVD